MVLLYYTPVRNFLLLTDYKFGVYNLMTSSRISGVIMNGL